MSRGFKSTDLGCTATSTKCVFIMLKLTCFTYMYRIEIILGYVLPRLPDYTDSNFPIEIPPNHPVQQLIVLFKILQQFRFHRPVHLWMWPSFLFVHAELFLSLPAQTVEALLFVEVEHGGLEEMSDTQVSLNSLELFRWVLR